MTSHSPTHSFDSSQSCTNSTSSELFEGGAKDLDKADSDIDNIDFDNFKVFTSMKTPTGSIKILKLAVTSNIMTYAKDYLN